MSRPWRLLLDGAASGAWNMGVDEALLATAARGGAPTLRFYTWNGAWLSLGYAQRADEAYRAACEASGVSLVRRVTGGGAVLHGADLTYAVAAHASDLPPGLRASYSLVSGALLAALRELGVDATATGFAAAERGARPFDCFAEPAGDEICAGGRKLAGSAQRRAGGGVLQHGSLRLRPDPAAAQAAARTGEGATSLLQLGLEASIEAVREACLAGFRTALGVPLECGALTPEERLQASERERRHRLAPLEVPPRGRTRRISRVQAGNR